MAQNKISTGEYPMADYIRALLKDGHQVAIRFNDTQSTNFQVSELHPYDDGKSQVVYVIRYVGEQQFMHAIDTTHVMMVTITN